jgi:hypothetical protein
MTRREFLLASSPAAVWDAPVSVPVRRVVDSRCTPRHLQRFDAEIWPETVRDFARCGIQLHVTEATGPVRRSPAGRPVFMQLRDSTINLILTDYVPLEWDQGRALRGVTRIYEGRHVCVVALKYAHCHQIPFLSVNTCIHELLHVLLHDIFESRPKGFMGEAREFRIDLYATRLWLFHDGAAIRMAAREYLARSRRPGR